MTSVLQLGGLPPPEGAAPAPSPSAVFRQQAHDTRLQEARQTFEQAEARAQWEYRARSLQQALSRPNLEPWEREGLHAELTLHYGERYSLAPLQLGGGAVVKAPTAAETEAAARAQQAKRDADAADLDRQVSEWARTGGRR